MTSDKINKIRNLVREKKPLIHSITNPISINLCANVCLGVGARPIMAEHPEEAADALLLNLGNITDTRLKSIEVSASAATKRKIPFALDAVGVACSALRRRFAKKLIEGNCPNVIKGNYSEIKALYNEEYKSSGVDAEELSIREVCHTAIQLAARHGTTVLASGKYDIVTDGKRLVYIKNGCAQLATVTGTGCMLGELCACFLAVDDGFEAAIAACAVLGICGELSETHNGSGTFMVNLADNLSTLDEEKIEKYMKLEEVEIERL